MAYAQNSRTGSAAPLFGWADRIAKRYKLWQQRREVYDRTYGELASLNDRELADIGLSRIMIRDIALQAALEA